MLTPVAEPKRECSKNPHKVQSRHDANQPYESLRAPREPAQRSVPDFSDRDAAELADLRQRVAELEMQVKKSWFTNGNIFHRVLAVWGYLLLGYVVMLAAVFGLMAFISAITNELP